VFEQAIQQYPDEWYAWAARGICLVHLNNLPEAERSFHRAAELAHKPRVTEMWQEVRAHMKGMPSTPPE
jgi:Flp pilus assembly protein TadD